MHNYFFNDPLVLFLSPSLSESVVEEDGTYYHQLTVINPSPLAQPLQLA